MEMTVIDRHVFDGRHERMQLLRDRDFDRYFEMLEAANDESLRFAERCIGLADEHGCVMLEKDGGTPYYYLHRSCRSGLEFQLTSWDEYGPVGHVDVRSADDITYIMNDTVIVSI